VRGLTRLPVTLLTTHAHWDHIGAHSQFDGFAVHEAERGWLERAFPLSPSAVIAQLTRLPCRFPEGFEPEAYRVFQGSPRLVLRGGERLSLGGRELLVLHTPGHSPGHCCFYEPARQYLYSGDLIYRGCLDAFYPSTDPRAFWKSVQSLLPLNVRRILPGHRSLSVPPGIIAEIDSAFSRLCAENNLRHGAGVFDFGSFQIHI